MPEFEWQFTLVLLTNGIMIGLMYALIALGFVLIYKATDAINFAQGEFVMLPAFLMLAAMQAGAPFWLAILTGILLSMLLLGLGFKILLVDPMLRHGVLPLVISTIALSLFLKESAKNFYSSQAQPFPALIEAGD
ncbi:MAG TPA: branched-chain amino acid ABC transporter permease, partial [Xanthobacteraceae bacterium]